MQFETAPMGVETLGVPTGAVLIAAIVLPLLVGAVMGLEREFAVVAACAGVLAAILGGV